MAKERVKDISGVIMAGGKCTRYNGKNKAFLKIHHQTFYEKTVQILDLIFEKMLVITNQPEDFPQDSLPKYKDIIKDIGPLGGIYTALSKADGVEAVFIFAGDMPFVNELIIRNMIDIFKQEKPDILIPKINNNIEPLLAIYSIRILKNLDNYLKTTTNFSVRSFIKMMNSQYFELNASDINKQAFININSPEDYEKYIGLI